MRQSWTLRSDGIFVLEIYAVLVLSALGLDFLLLIVTWLANVYTDGA